MGGLQANETTGQKKRPLKENPFQEQKEHWGRKTLKKTIISARHKSAELGCGQDSGILSKFGGGAEKTEKKGARMRF